MPKAELSPVEGAPATGLEVMLVDKGVTNAVSVLPSLNWMRSVCVPFFSEESVE